ncbi:hypothetical protein WKK05_39390 (plasmid) [Nostoc sp. UHCC 0302]|uniref:hypothetical protein n=1 Tax=Nostoc sp. UHCC 0302 TaxID=3134896 RepID=UPI00311C8D8F
MIKYSDGKDVVSFDVNNRLVKRGGRFRFLGLSSFAAFVSLGDGWAFDYGFGLAYYIFATENCQ